MNQFKETYTLPFKQTISADLVSYFARKSVYKRWIKFMQRYLYAKFALFHNKEILSINSAHKNILWIHWGIPSLGDSLMNLSARILLKNHQVDVLVNPNVAILYQNDLVFNRVFTNPSQCSANQYDLIIINSHRHRSLKIVKQYFKTIDFVSLYKYYDGFDFNQTFFCFFRINQLLSYPFDTEYIQKIAKPILSIDESDKQIINQVALSNSYITIAIGGRANNRTFNSWGVLIKKIITQNPSEKIVLIGGKNDVKTAILLSKMNSNILNLTGKYSFKQTVEIISRSKMLLCCDGGLLHGANSTDVKMLVLFASVKPELRLTQTERISTLYDKDNVNNIRVDDIFEKFNTDVL